MPRNVATFDGRNSRIRQPGIDLKGCGRFVCIIPSNAAVISRP
jgi:hypothetical protein